MCGICGIVKARSERVNPAMINSMMKTMASRGPDASGMFMQGNMAFGHRRLKVFDLSERAQQPMVDSALGFTIVYNGAIYNYRELRLELEKHGYTFFSSGDTEVLLKAYHAWGDAALERLNGMFAFAIWERDTGRLTLARDRLGIKPLYYAETDRLSCFASSLPAILSIPDVDKSIDPVALHYYMTFHSVVPPQRTILQGVRKLPPATIMTIEPDGTTVQKQYWSLQFSNDPEEERYDFHDWKMLVRNKLDEAVRRRLIADVPVGVLLSGGLDSSLVVGLLSEAGQSALHTFSIGFESVGGRMGDEFIYSDLIAKHFNTSHHKMEIDADTTLSSLDDCIQAMNEPMVSHDCIGFFLLSREVSRYVKVVQSGQGADEVFGGYHWYPPMMDTQTPTDTYASVFFDGDHDAFATAVDARFVGTNHSRQFIENQFSLPGAEKAIDKALRVDTTVMLVDDPVKRVDNMTMAWGLEARVPFLDHELVECAARVPAKYKVADGGKHILKAIGRDVIPSEVIDRPKGYFPVPALTFFRGPYLEFVTRIMRDPATTRRRLFNAEYVNRVLEAPDQHITPLNGSRLWQMALLNHWLNIHQI